LISRFGSGAPWEGAYGYSRAVRAGDVFIAWPGSAVDEDGVVLAPGDAAGQVEAIVDIIEAALARAGARLEDVVQTRIYVTDITRHDEVGRAHGARFGANPPVTAMVQVASLLDPRMLVEIEAVAYVGG